VRTVRFVVYSTTLLVLLSASACSYEDKRKVETAVEQSVDRFRIQVRSQQYHEIYAESAPELRSRVSETEFAAQLAAVHAYGASASKAIVIIDDTVWRGVKRTFNSREMVSHVDVVSSDTMIANETFVWAVENDQPKLVSYEFTPVCKRPCSVGFGQ
jgi:hypothetical protein